MSKVADKFLTYIFRCCGSLLIYTLGYFLGTQWKSIALICCPVPILAFFASLKSPDSPVFLMSHGNELEALSAVKTLYGPQYDSKLELTIIKKDLSGPKAFFRSLSNDVKESGIYVNFLNFLERFKKPEIYKPFQIIVLLGFVQQFSGMTILRSYVVKIFNDIFETEETEDGSIAKEAYIAAIVIGMMRLISSLLLSKLLYHFERRRLYFISGKSNLLLGKYQ